MTTVSILGAGELGGSVAHALARAERVGRVVLIDEGGTIAAGKALDIQQSGAIDGFHTRVEGTQDLTRVTGCTVCVVADTGRPAAEWQGDAGLAMMRRLKGFVGEAPIVFAGAAQADLLLAAVREAGFRRDRVVGSAPEALAAAARAIVALEAQCSPSEVALSVLGVPSSGFIVPWSEASIAGHAVERVLTQVQVRRVEARVALLWPPGPLALGAAAAGVVEAIVTSARRARRRIRRAQSCRCAAVSARTGRRHRGPATSAEWARTRSARNRSRQIATKCTKDQPQRTQRSQRLCGSLCSLWPKLRNLRVKLYD
jgi:malate dehydrogenase